MQPKTIEGFYHFTMVTYQCRYSILMVLGVFGENYCAQIIQQNGAYRQKEAFR